MLGRDVWLTTLSLPFQTHLQRTALVSNTLVYVLLLLWDAVALQSSLIYFLQKRVSDKVLLQYYLHFHQKDILLQCLVFHLVLQVYHDFVKLFLNDILSVRESLELFCQAL